MIDKIWRSLTLFKILGFTRALKTIQYHGKKKFSRWYHQLPSREWPNRYQDIPSPQLSFLQKRERSFARNELLLADQYARNCFDLLGSGKQCFQVIPWHQDIRLHAQNPSADSTFEAHTYFKNIVIEVGHTHKLSKDIKVPWELARFAYAPVLALAYHQTNNNLYVDAAKKQIISWLDANTFCYGIHWFNGMEVAIRAVNWIIALQWLAAPFSQDVPFYQRLICSLYDHMRYLEQNWEWYDGRTNNHYLTNLVGYAYLCSFFGDTKKWQWSYEQLLQEFAWQVFDEGTSYEGSTRYHHFVTELFLHGFLIAHEMGETIEVTVRKKLERMILFSEQCKPATDQDSIVIGDDDGGSLLDKRIFNMRHFYSSLSIDHNAIASMVPQKNYYKHFGISFSRQNNWHISLRHHAYTQRQPTGHFHHDAGSITIAYKGIPIIVDPGTYVYTASSYWRNYFRAPQAHNTMYRTDTSDTMNLFALPLEPLMTEDICMKALIMMPEGRIERNIIREENQVYIIDRCMFDQPQLITWNFTFAPHVKLSKQNTTWHGAINNMEQIRYHSTLSCVPYDTWISSEYGSIEKTVGLRSSKEVTQGFQNQTQIVFDE